MANINFLSDSNVTGTLQLSSYGSGTNTGTATYTLGVDTNGNVIELTAPLGSGGANRVAFWNSSTTLSSNADFTWNGINLQLSGNNHVLGIGDPSGGAKGTVDFFAWNSDVFYIQQREAGGTIRTETDNFIVKNHGGGETYIQAQDNGSVDLYYDDVKKFETTSAGVSITGSATISTIANASSDTDKFLVSDGGVLKYRTGAEVRSDIGAGTGSGTVTGTGTANSIPKWSSSSALTDSEISDTGSVIKLGLDASSQETLYLDTVNRKVGFRTQSPGSAFDVNGTIRVRNQLNVGHTTEQNLFVNGDGTAGGRYVKMGNYGVPGGASPDNGNYFGITGTENQPKYCAAFGNAGKIVQDMRIITIKLSGDAFKLLSTTGTTLIPAPGANSLIIPYEFLVHNTGGTAGNWNTASSTTAAIGFCDGAGTCNYPGQFNRLFVINNGILRTNGAWYLAAGIATTGKVMTLNKPLLLKASQNLTTVPTGSWYIQIRYQIMNKDSGLIQNVDITKTTN